MMVSSVFYIITMALTATLVDGQIPSSCVVNQSKIDCRNSGLTELPDLSNINSSITDMDFSENQIKSITQIKVPQGNKITNLDLHNNLIITIDDQSFMGLTSLEHLDLSTNGIQKITTSTFSGLTNIQEINVGYNKLDLITGGTFPHSVTSLILDGNNLQAMPDEAFIALDQLNYLEINNNPFTSIHGRPDPIEFTISATYVSLNNMPNLEIVSPAAFEHFRGMQRLNMSNNPKLKEVADGAFPSTLKVLTNVTMSNNSLASVPEHMMEWSNLKQLDLSGNPFVCDKRFCWMLKQRSVFSGFSDNIR